MLLRIFSASVFDVISLATHKLTGTRVGENSSNAGDGFSNPSRLTNSNRTSTGEAEEAEAVKEIGSRRRLA